MNGFLPLPDPGVEGTDAAGRSRRFLGSIVEAATAWWWRGLFMHTAVPCRRRPGRGPRCEGHVIVYSAETPREIHWLCSVCTAAGILRGHRWSPWDLSEVPLRGDPCMAFWPCALLDPAEHRALVRDLPVARPLWRLLRAAETTPAGVLLTGPSVEFAALLAATRRRAASAAGRGGRALLASAAERLLVALAEDDPDMPPAPAAARPGEAD
jgi:hypothetical protein